MKQKNIKQFTSCALFLGLSLGSANAAVVISDSAAAVTPEGTFVGASGTVSFTTSDFGTFDPSGTSKLVVALGTEHTPSGLPFTSATYGGEAMTFAGGIGGGANDFEAAIYYLDNPTAAGTLDVVADRARGVSAAVISLNGTASGIGAVSTSAGASTSLTTTSNDSLVLASTTFDARGGTTVPTATSTLSDVIGINNPYNPGGATHSIATGSQAVSSSGTAITPTFSGGTNTVAVEFTVIPEPSVALLGSLGLLALLRRRR